MVRKSVTCIAFSLMLLWCSVPLHADVRLVANVQTTTVLDGRTTTQPQTMVVLVKGRKVRREVGNTVVLYDRDENQVYTCDLQKKTFWVLSSRAAMERGLAAYSNTTPYVLANTEIDLRQGRDNGQETWRDIAGVSAKMLSVSGSALYQPTPPVTSGEAPQIKVSGAVYVAETMSLLGVEKRDAVALSYPLVQSLLPEDSPLTGVLANRLGRRTPIAGTITVELIQPPAPMATTPAPAPTVNPGRPMPQPTTAVRDSPPVPSENRRPTILVLTQSLTTSSVDDTVTLDDVLFVVPNDYTQIDPPIVKPVFPLPVQRATTSKQNQATKNATGGNTDD